MSNQNEFLTNSYLDMFVFCVNLKAIFKVVLPGASMSWMCAGAVGCIFIHLFAGAVEWEASCFATTLLHPAPPKVTSVLVLFVIFGGLFSFIGVYVYLHKLHLLAISVVFPIALPLICCVMFTVNDFEVVDCGHELTLLLSLFSFRSTWMSF